MQTLGTIHYTSAPPTDLQKLLELYNSVEWTRYANCPEKLLQTIEESSYVICAYEGERLVGLVRGLSDCISTHFIQDLLVHQDYQKQGVGRTLLHKALHLYPESRKHVLLTDDRPSIKQFYEFQGFENLEDSAPKVNAFIKWGESSDRYQEVGLQCPLDAGLVQRLVNSQFPQWAHLPIWPVTSGGWDNRTFHLGYNMLVRLPSGEEYAPAVKKEHTWLPRLAPLLSWPIPTPLAMGQPEKGYPWRWSVYRWIEGETAANASLSDMKVFATDLADFILALESIDTTGGPLPHPGNFSYIEGLSVYDEETRRAVAALEGKLNGKMALEVWEAALQTKWQHPPVWVHGDLTAGNILTHKGKLSAVIDFGGLGVGDPACDLVIAWKFFNKEARDVFKQKLPFDAGTWARGRAWALWKALILAAGLCESNSVETENSWRTIEEVLKDWAESKDT